MASGSVVKVMLMMALTLAAIVGMTNAKTYIVGDKSGWTIPSSPSLYTDWASKQTFQVGDTLVFNFPVNAHTVAEVSKTAYDSCSTSNPLSAAKTTAPANYTLSSGGTHYYLCTIPGHCKAGQKLSITVSGPSKSPSPSPSPSSAATPPSPTGGSTTPPTTSPSSAATPPSGGGGTTVPPSSSQPPSAASGPSGEASQPPAGNFAAQTTAGFGLLSLVSVTAAVFLF